MGLKPHSQRPKSHRLSWPTADTSSPCDPWEMAVASLYLTGGLTQEAQGLGAHFLEPVTRTAAPLTAEEASDMRGRADT